MSAARMQQIASHRLASVRALQALGAEQTGVLAAVDAAARGEIGQIAAEELLTAHLAAREACISSMRAYDTEWRELAQGAGSWSASESEAVQGASREILVLLAAIEADDARFARELTERRNGAQAEIARADNGLAAQRAYGATRDPHPRFTDRRC